MDNFPPQSLTIEVVSGSRPGVQIIRLSGLLTIQNFQEFQELTRHGPFPDVMLVDLTDVSYLDSSALGTFVGIHVSCEGSNRRYALVNPNERLKGLFDLSNVSAFLVVYDSVEQAEAALA